MEGKYLAGVVDSDFQGIQINFAPPRPAGFTNFHGAGRGGARLAFLQGGAGQPFFRGAGWGRAHIPARNPPLKLRYVMHARYLSSVWHALPHLGRHEVSQCNCCQGVQPSADRTEKKSNM